VTVVGWLFLLQGAVLAAIGVAGLAAAWLVVSGEGLRGLDLPATAGEAAAQALLLLITLGLGPLSLIVALGLFRIRPWAWLMAMALQGVSLATELGSYLIGEADYLAMAMSVLIVLSLNQQEVRVAFAPREKSGG